MYRAAKEIPWEHYFKESSTLAIDANLDSHPHLRNSHFAALVVKDAVCDRMRERRGYRPSVEIQSPTIQLNLFIQKGIATLSFDTSLDPLFKRGYRLDPGPAPLQESLAAALLQVAGYQPEKDIFCDPFCGSGTFLMEAAMLQTSTPAGFFRKKWGFFEMPEFDSATWRASRAQADRARIPLLENTLVGADFSEESMSRTRRHLDAAGFALHLQASSIQHLKPVMSPTLILCNPPYGRRLQTSRSLYQSLGRFAGQYPSARLFFIAPDATLAEATNLPCHSQFSFRNGGLPVHLFSGASHSYSS